MAGGGGGGGGGGGWGGGEVLRPVAPTSCSSCCYGPICRASGRTSLRPGGPIARLLCGHQSGKPPLPETPIPPLHLLPSPQTAFTSLTVRGGRAERCTAGRRALSGGRRAVGVKHGAGGGGRRDAPH